MWGLLMLNLGECSLYYLHLWLVVFEAGDSTLKACRYVKRWCEPGSNTTQCLRGPTKAQWCTDKHGTFSTLTQTKQYSLLQLFHFFLVLMAVSLKPWREGLYLCIGPSLCYLSLIHLPEISDKFHLIIQSKPPSIHARHDKACPCDNSLLTLLFQMVSVTRTNQILFLRMIASQERRTSRLFFYLKLATQIVRKALPKTSHTEKFWCGSDGVQNRNLKWRKQ